MKFPQIKMEQVEKRKCFGGFVYQFKHSSESVGCEMKFRVFLPKESENGKVPAIFFLAGIIFFNLT